MEQESGPRRSSGWTLWTPLDASAWDPHGTRIRAPTPEGAKGHLFSVRAVAARLGVSTATVYRLCDCGELPHLRVSNAIRIRAEDLDAYRAAALHG